MEDRTGKGSRLAILGFGVVALGLVAWQLFRKAPTQRPVVVAVDPDKLIEEANRLDPQKYSLDKLCRITDQWKLAVVATSVKRYRMYCRLQEQQHPQAKEMAVQYYNMSNQLSQQGIIADFCFQCQPGITHEEGANHEKDPLSSQTFIKWLHENREKPEIQSLINDVNKMKQDFNENQKMDWCPYTREEVPSKLTTAVYIKMEELYWQLYRATLNNIVCHVKTTKKWDKIPKEVMEALEQKVLQSKDAAFLQIYQKVTGDNEITKEQVRTAILKKYSTTLFEEDSEKQFYAKIDHIHKRHAECQVVYKAANCEAAAAPSAER